MSGGLVLLKLGGSLITDKNHPHTARMDVLRRLAEEIAEARVRMEGLQLILGHGSGSFGHVVASKHNTRRGVKSAREWKGFVEVYREAAELNHIVLHVLGEVGLPALAFPPSATVTSRAGKVAAWNLEPLLNALDRGLLPVINGDTVFDTLLGGTILSTEDLFAYLAGELHPERILLAGSEPGVWADFPYNTRLLHEITPESFAHIEVGLGGSAATDVTGGMKDKVNQVIAMLQVSAGLRACIFSGEQPGNVRRALLGEALGTDIHA